MPKKISDSLRTPTHRCSLECASLTFPLPVLRFLLEFLEQNGKRETGNGKPKGGSKLLQDTALLQYVIWRAVARQRLFGARSLTSAMTAFLPMCVGSHMYPMSSAEEYLSKRHSYLSLFGRAGQIAVFVVRSSRQASRH